MYRTGGQNGNAYGMSRLPLKAGDGGDEGDHDPNRVFMVDLINAVESGEVRRETERDVILTRVKEFVMEGWPDEFDANEDFRPYKRRSEELSSEMGCVLWGGRVIVPVSLQEKVLKELHVGHTGMSRMKMLARSYCWWPNMDKRIEEVVGNCGVCIEHARNPSPSILHPWEMPARPWSRVHIDHAGPFLGRMFLIVVDSYSKWVDIYNVPSTSTEHVMEKLRESFAVQGLPDSIISDNASCFTSDEFQEFCKKNGVLHTTSAPYHPSSNGQAERTVQTFKQTMRKLTSSSKASVATHVFVTVIRYASHAQFGDRNQSSRSPV